MGIFIAYPWLAVLISAAFGVLWWYRHHPSALAATILWMLYAIYEYLMYVRLWCSGECNIRVDLLLIYPLLLAVSAVALVRTLWKKR